MMPSKRFEKVLNGKLGEKLKSTLDMKAEKRRMVTHSLGHWKQSKGHMF